MTDNTQQAEVKKLDDALQEYLEKEAASYAGFITRNEVCPRHHCPLDLTPDYHIECGICVEEMLSHAIGGDK